MGSTIAPEKILKDLAALWTDTGKPGEGEAGNGVLRACSMTLVVLAEAAEDTQDVGETLAALMPEHPARTIIVRLSGPGERSLAERVYSQCWMPFGQRRQICCEQVEITLSDAALGDLESVVLPLRVPDLPFIVWCRSNRLTVMKEFWQIAAMADKVVIDTSDAPDPMDALMHAQRLSARSIMLGDLSWTRMTKWREMLAKVFQNQANLQLLNQVSKIQVEWGGSRLVPAVYLGVWVRDSLSRLDAAPELTMVPNGADDVLGLKLMGEGIELELARREDRMVVTLNGASQCTNLPRPTDYLLMREELGILRHDPVFERTLASAAKL
jgi:glucose-6-phosphate dehydrogenase assembly protein OpcA